jgi:hypothetical protein
MWRKERLVIIDVGEGSAWCGGKQLINKIIIEHDLRPLDSGFYTGHLVIDIPFETVGSNRREALCCCQFKTFPLPTLEDLL